MKIKKGFIITIVVIIIFIILNIASCKTASTNTDEALVESTEEIAEIQDITPAEVSEIIQNDEDYIILDVRTQDEYNDGHLEKAQLISVDTIEHVLDILPKDKPIIVYCQGGVRSRRAAEILVNNGFDPVYDMGGITEWIDEGYPVIVEKGAVSAILYLTVDEAYDFFNSEREYLFIDVRSQAEYEYSHIEGAISIPATEFAERVDEIPRGIPLIVYCNGTSCDKSGYAAGVLKENKYREVYDVVGEGFFEWTEKGYPVIGE
jgi:rhodanese-related sulfurtransferase